MSLLSDDTKRYVVAGECIQHNLRGEGSFIIANDGSDWMCGDERAEDFIDCFFSLALSWDCMRVSRVDVDQYKKVCGVLWRSVLALLQ